MLLKLLDTAFTKSIVRNALKIALVVGTLLNLINQAEPILENNGINWLEFFLNYLIPYCVASYSAAKNQLTQEINNQ